MRSLITAIIVSSSLLAFAAPGFAAPDQSWNLARAVLRADVAATGELVAQLGSEEPEVAARAARIARVIGVSDQHAFTRLVMHPRLTMAGRRALRDDLLGMPEASTRRQALIALAEEAEVVARTAGKQ